MNNFKIFLTLFLIFSATYASADAGNDASLPESIINKYIPEEVKISPVTGSAAVYLKDLSVVTKNARFDRSNRYVVALYSNIQDCSLVVFKKLGAKYQLMQNSVLQSGTTLSGCDEVDIKDLNQDKIDEVVITRSSGSDTLAPVIFKWKKDHLVDISPVQNINGKPESPFREVSITDKAVQNKLLIFDYDANDSGAKRRLYEFDGKKIELVGEYDLLSYISKSAIKIHKGKIVVEDAADLKPAFPAEGQYTLTVKNVSDHHWPVRAEVTVNGSVVIKPQDFCKAPPHKRSDKLWWKGHDDDDDQDEDHLKRCVGKNEAYAIVNMKTANEIKVKVYGIGNSRVQLSLVKK